MTTTPPDTILPPRPGFWSRTTDAVHRFIIRLVYLLAPLVATGVVLVAVWWFTDWGYVEQAVYAGTLSLVGFGTTVVFGKAVLDEMDWLTLGTWDLAFIVMWVNAASAFFYTYNLDLLERVPRLGPSLKSMREDAKITVEQRPWIRRLSTVGVGLFVLSPLPGSGSLGGSIVGRLIGLSRRATALAVLAAGIAVCTAYAMLGEKVRRLLEDVPWWAKVAGAVVGFSLLFLFLRWLRRGASRLAAADRAARDRPAPAGAPHREPASLADADA
jgi:uncharacterized membrane protein